LLVAIAGCAPYQGEGLSPEIGSSAAVHQVQRGETLWSIARRCGVSVDDLVRENRISDVSQIEVGQTLKIPPGSAATRFSAERPVPPALKPSGGTVRSARPGEEPSWRAGGAQEQFAWPAQGRVISIFGTRWKGRVNKGIDVQVQPGAEVRASRSGKVSFVHEGLPGFGKTIILEHAEGFASVYACVGEILVRQGDGVGQRQVIARMGEQGPSRPPALHFEIRRSQKAQNPLHYLP